MVTARHTQADRLDYLAELTMKEPQGMSSDGSRKLTVIRPGDQMSARPHHLRLSRSGVTLVELMMAVVIGTIVMGMVVGGMNSINRYLIRVTQRSLANDEARLLNEFLIDRIRIAGGGSAYPYATAWVSNDASGSGSDAITIAHLSRYSSQLIGTYPVLGILPIMSASGAGCALTAVFVNQHIMVIDRNEQFWSLWYVTGVDTVLCQLQVSPSAETHLNYVPAGSDTLNATTQVAAVAPTHIFLDETTQELHMQQDANLDNVLETTVLADRVVDLQAALGYDVNPWDWRIDDTYNTADEWLYNAFGDVMGSTSGQRLDSARRIDLRMLRVSVMIGAPVRSITTRNTMQLLDGPIRFRDGWVLGSATSDVGLRNYNILR